MNSSGSIVKPASRSSSFLDWVTKYEALVIFGGFGLAMVASIIFIGMFQAGPIVRDNVLFNIVIAFAMSVGFVYLIFRFMGSKIVVFGYPLDIGLVVYIAIIMYVIFILGN